MEIQGAWARRIQDADTAAGLKGGATGCVAPVLWTGTMPREGVVVVV
jgi:hypothetical protein